MVWYQKYVSHSIFPCRASTLQQCQDFLNTLFNDGFIYLTTMNAFVKLGNPIFSSFCPSSFITNAYPGYN